MGSLIGSLMGSLIGSLMGSLIGSLIGSPIGSLSRLNIGTELVGEGTLDMNGEGHQ